MTVSNIPTVLMDFLGPQQLPKAYALLCLNVGMVILLPTPFAGMYCLCIAFMLHHKSQIRVKYSQHKTTLVHRSIIVNFQRRQKVPNFWYMLYLACFNHIWKYNWQAGYMTSQATMMYLSMSSVALHQQQHCCSLWLGYSTCRPSPRM